MFFARIRNDENKLNGIEIQTLKNKLGILYEKKSITELYLVNNN
jgi:hypothetical protein